RGASGSGARLRPAPRKGPRRRREQRRPHATEGRVSAPAGRPAGHSRPRAGGRGRRARPGDLPLLRGRPRDGRGGRRRPCRAVRNEQARPHVEELGARAIAPEGFEDEGEFDVVLELVGGPNMAGNLKALATGGRVVVIGVGAGPVAEVNLLTLMGKRARISAS